MAVLAVAALAVLFAQADAPESAPGDTSAQAPEGAGLLGQPAAGGEEAQGAEPLVRPYEEVTRGIRPPEIIGSVRQELFVDRFRARSLLNPANVLGAPVAFQRLAGRLRVSQNLGRRIRLIGDIYLQSRVEFLPEPSSGAPDGQEHHAVRNVNLAYLNKLTATLFLFNDALSLKVGKHQTQIGNSLAEYELIPYRRYVNNRPDEGVNVIDDEGLWAAALTATFASVSADLYFIPKYDLKLPRELKNVVDSHALQLITSAVFGGIDARLQVFVDHLNQIDKLAPFVALALSYAAPNHPALTLAVDAALLNYKDRLRFRWDLPQPTVETRPRVRKVLSPVLVGVGYTFADWLQAKVEYLYDDYGMSRPERRELFKSLKSSPQSVGLVAQNWRRNLFSKHYLLASLLMPRLWEKLDVFLGFKQSLTDGSAQMVGNLVLSTSDTVRIECEFLSTVRGGELAEFGNGFIERRLGLKIGYYF